MSWIVAYVALVGFVIVELVLESADSQNSGTKNRGRLVPVRVRSRRDGTNRGGGSGGRMH